MRDFRDCYAALGLSTDTDWGSLRAHYRRLISQWHPDRFAADSGQRQLAEECSKRITAAYHALENYRREHGTLPFVPPAAAPDAIRPQARPAYPASDAAASSDRAETGAASASKRGRAIRARRRRLALAAALLVAVLYFAQEYFGESLSGDAGPADGIYQQDVAQVPPGETQGPREQRVISLGSTLGEVFAVQGIPTRTQGETWHYGKSEIRFSHGKVVSWTEHPDSPLSIARNLPVLPRDGTFQVGSTKEDVRATQGAPVTESGTVWDYGLSRVYFEHDRVIRWEESPMQPLRLPR